MPTNVGEQYIRFTRYSSAATQTKIYINNTIMYFNRNTNTHTTYGGPYYSIPYYNYTYTTTTVNNGEAYGTGSPPVLHNRSTGAENGKLSKDLFTTYVLDKGTNLTIEKILE